MNTLHVITLEAAKATECTAGEMSDIGDWHDAEAYRAQREGDIRSHDRHLRVAKHLYNLAAALHRA